MGLSDDLKSAVMGIYKGVWELRDGNKVPEADDLGLGNDGVKLEGAVLYSDLVGSSTLVSSTKASRAAEVYKAFLHCASKIINAEGGSITAYDGDRIMAVYIGNSRRTDAVRTALKINWAVLNLVNPL